MNGIEPSALKTLCSWISFELQEQKKHIKICCNLCLHGCGERNLSQGCTIPQMRRISEPNYYSLLYWYVICKTVSSSHQQGTINANAQISKLICYSDNVTSSMLICVSLTHLPQTVCCCSRCLYITQLVGWCHVVLWIHEPRLPFQFSASIQISQNTLHIWTVIQQHLFPSLNPMYHWRSLPRTQHLKLNQTHYSSLTKN
jgi:hypothetical protein